MSCARLLPYLFHIAKYCHQHHKGMYIIELNIVNWCSSFLAKCNSQNSALLCTQSVQMQTVTKSGGKHSHLFPLGAVGSARGGQYNLDLSVRINGPAVVGKLTKQIWKSDGSLRASGTPTCPTPLCKERSLTGFASSGSCWLASGSFRTRHTFLAPVSHNYPC